MNGPLFALLAKRFEGIASIGEFSTEDGTVIVHVHPAPGDPLPTLDKVNQALAIGEDVEDQLGIVVVVKGAEPARPALAN